MLPCRSYQAWSRREIAGMLAGARLPVAVVVAEVPTPEARAFRLGYETALRALAAQCGISPAEIGLPEDTCATGRS